jgi:hypothetical protein
VGIFVALSLELTDSIVIWAGGNLSGPLYHRLGCLSPVPRQKGFRDIRGKG